MTYQARTLEQWEQRGKLCESMGAWLTEEEAKLREVERALDPLPPLPTEDQAYMESYLELEDEYGARGWL